jgi:hypothetical protein
VEFRLSSAVKPDRVQQILYGDTLEPYICADLIGKVLVERTAARAQLIITDCRSALDLRLTQETPVAWLAGEEGLLTRALSAAGTEVSTPNREGIRLFCHARFPLDVPAVKSTLDCMDGQFDLIEPFARIRGAMEEAKHLGAATRGE